MAVQLRLVSESLAEIENAIKSLGNSFSVTSSAKAGRNDVFLSYGIFVESEKLSRKRFLSKQLTKSLVEDAKENVRLKLENP